jgi:ribulose kinase
MSIQEYERCGTVIDTIRVTGGATKSDLWMSIIASVTGKQLFKSEADGACIGAAAIAAVSAGLYKNYEEAMSIMSATYPMEICNADDISFYSTKYQRYMSAWKHIANIYE